MPIVVSHTPSPAFMGFAGYLGGFGDYLKERERFGLDVAKFGETQRQFDLSRELEEDRLDLARRQQQSNQRLQLMQLMQQRAGMGMDYALQQQRMEQQERQAAQDRAFQAQQMQFNRMTGLEQLYLRQQMKQEAEVQRRKEIFNREILQQSAQDRRSKLTIAQREAESIREAIRTGSIPEEQIDAVNNQFINTHGYDPGFSFMLGEEQETTPWTMPGGDIVNLPSRDGELLNDPTKDGRFIDSERAHEKEIKVLEVEYKAQKDAEVAIRKDIAMAFSQEKAARERYDSLRKQQRDVLDKATKDPLAPLLTEEDKAALTSAEQEYNHWKSQREVLQGALANFTATAKPKTVVIPETMTEAKVPPSTEVFEPELTPVAPEPASADSSAKFGAGPPPLPLPKHEGKRLIEGGKVDIGAMQAAESGVVPIVTDRTQLQQLQYGEVYLKLDSDLGKYVLRRKTPPALRIPKVGDKVYLSQLFDKWEQQYGDRLSGPKLKLQRAIEDPNIRYLTDERQARYLSFGEQFLMIGDDGFLHLFRKTAPP